MSPPIRLGIGLGLSISPAVIGGASLSPESEAAIDTYIADLKLATTVSTDLETALRAEMETLFLAVDVTRFATLITAMYPDAAANALNLVDDAEGFLTIGGTMNYSSVHRVIYPTSTSYAANGTIGSWSQIRGFSCETGVAMFQPYDLTSFNLTGVQYTPSLSPSGSGQTSGFFNYQESGGSSGSDLGALLTQGSFGGFAITEPNLTTSEQEALENFFWNVHNELTGRSGQTGFQETSLKKIYAKRTTTTGLTRLYQLGLSPIALTTSYQEIGELDVGESNVQLLSYYSSGGTDFSVVSFNSDWRSSFPTTTGNEINNPADSGETEYTTLTPWITGYGDLYIDVTG